MKRLNKIQLMQDKASEIIEQEKALEVREMQNDPEELEESAPFWEGWREKMKIKPFPWKGLNAKNALIAGCLVLIALAGYLNIRYGLTRNPVEPAGEVAGQEQGGESLESYFANAMIDRERVRDEALEVLVSITEDETADSAAKATAYEEMERIANETSAEIDIENLVKAKGFAECIAVINDENANIVVQSAGLTAGEVAQIKEIVYLQAEILPKNIKIMEKS